MNYLFAFILFLIISVSKLKANVDSLYSTHNYNVTHYHLNIEPSIIHKYLKASNSIRFDAVANQPTNYMRVELHKNFEINYAILNGDTVDFDRDTLGLTLSQIKLKPKDNQLTIGYEGFPKVAIRPPWKGGFVWSVDSLYRPLIGVACQGDKASVWYPCKNDMSDEPDSFNLSVKVRKDLVAVGNGQLDSIQKFDDKFNIYHWKVTYPINNYAVSFYIGNFKKSSKFHVYNDEQGIDTLKVDYYLLDYQQNKVEGLHQQTTKMLNTYNKYFGRYPFFNDGLKYVFAPYWGMEHQSAIAYGNNFKKNEFDFDFILIHETGHEWWGNCVTAINNEHLWIHEGFTTYMESLYVEENESYESALEYLRTQSKNIKNEKPLISEYNVSKFEGDNDIYYKGTWILHSLRNWVGNDSIWFTGLKKIYQSFMFQNINSQQVIDAFAKEFGEKIRPVLFQYLYYPRIPEAEITVTTGFFRKKLKMRWAANERDFTMPINIIGSDYINFKFEKIGTRYRKRVIKIDPDIRLYFNKSYSLGESFYLPTIYKRPTLVAPIP